MNPKYPFVAARAKHQCEYCYAPEVIFNLAFEVEHIIPLAKGGANDLQNLALACRICNLRKSDFIDSIDTVTQEQVRLFNPRLDTWQEHFVFNRESCQIQGRTPIGRATVERLRMNTPEQITARSLWVALGIFGNE
ncbi:MAG: HNH endonuclease signature motif containing protein [Microcoleaceae cyanobacterium]